MGDESFALIEKKITDLVQVVTALKKDKEALTAEVARKDGGGEGADTETVRTVAGARRREGPGGQDPFPARHH